PTWYANDLDYGRMNKAIIYALKARTLLYAASPLWNGNTDYANFITKEGKQLVSQQVDLSKWAMAAAAAKQVIDLNIFSLYKKYDGNGQIDAFTSYQDLFLEPWNTEVIFARKNNL